MFSRSQRQMLTQIFIAIYAQDDRQDNRDEWERAVFNSNYDKDEDTAFS